MGLLDFSAASRRSGDAAAVAAFVDENAAFLMQKESTSIPVPVPATTPRCCSGNRNSTQPSRGALARLSAGPGDRRRSGGGVSRERIRGERGEVLQILTDQVLAAFDRYPSPDALGTDEWRELRAELVRRLQLIGLHPPKRIIDIPEQWTQAYFDLMPIHEKAAAAATFHHPQLSARPALQHPRGVRATARPAGSHRILRQRAVA